MQLDTLLKVGSLAFDVAKDDNVRELFTMVHKGAKRRGLIGNPMPAQGQKPASQAQASASDSAEKANAHPVPFKPDAGSGAGSKAAGYGGADWNQLLSGQNAKKLLGVAGQIGQMLMK